MSLHTRQDVRGAIAAAIVLGLVGSATAAFADNQEASEPPCCAGWRVDDGFVIVSSDGRYRLRVGLVAGYKVEPVYRDGSAQDRSAFFVVRPFLAGNLLFPWIKFKTSLELAANPPYLLDSYVEVAPWRALGVRVGQQKTPFSRHKNRGDEQILFPDFDPVASYFWTGRDKGLTVVGSLADRRFDYAAGVYGGSPLRQFVTVAGNYLVEARATVSPLGPSGETEYPYITENDPAGLRPSFSLDGYYGKVQSAVENFDPSAFSFTAMPSGSTQKGGALGADVLLQGRRFAAIAEGYWRRAGPEGSAFTSLGLWGQLGILLVPHTLDLGVRVSWANPSTTLADDRLIAGEVQLAYYVHAPNLVLKLRYGNGDQHSPGMTALGPVTLPLAAGHTQLVTLQFNLAL
jgi:hypothetical protein